MKNPLFASLLLVRGAVYAAVLAVIAHGFLGLAAHIGRVLGGLK
jgi:hypothetical protein